jgi:methyl-accepting chemotaxis protein
MLEPLMSQSAFATHKSNFGPPDHLNTSDFGRREFSLNLKIWAGSFILAALVIGFSITNFYLLRSIQSNFDNSKAFENTLTSQLHPLALKSKDIQQDVIQVQQFLTDVSATRGENGLDDGFDEAEKNAVKFEADLKEITNLAKSLGALNLLPKADILAAQFQPYYEVGQKMARGYVEGGPAVGNKLMPEFDEASDNLQKVMDDFLSAADERINAGNKMLQDAQTSVDSSIKKDIQLQIIVGVLMLLAIAGMNLIASRSILKPISIIKKTMEDLTSGATDKEIPYQEASNEIGAMARALSIFQKTIISSKELSEREIQERQLARESRRKELHQLADHLEESVGGIAQAIATTSNELTATAKNLSTSARNTSEQSTKMAAASEEASSNVQTVANAAEQLWGSIREISERVHQSSAISSSAAQEAERSSNLMQELAKAADRIGGIVDLISNIASQTNMLALNATIEAARAGEAGRGFAIVAQEVKALAEQTTNATTDISTQISGIQASTQQAATVIETISKTIREVDAIATSIASAVEEQGAATQEIVRNIQYAGSSSMDVGRTIVHVSKAAEGSTQSSQDVLHSARSLSDHAKILRDEVHNFLQRVRAA